MRVADVRERRLRYWLLWGTLGLVLALVLTACWHSWSGGYSYGPRLLTDIMPIACLWFGIGYDCLPGSRPRFLAGILVFLSILIQAIGVFGNEQSWHERHYRGRHRRDLFQLQDNQISSGFFHLVHKLQDKKNQNSRSVPILQ